MLGTVARRSNLLGRNVTKTFFRNGSYHGGTPCENMPFKVDSKGWITWNFIWYGVTGLGSPFLILWHQMSKK